MKRLTIQIILMTAALLLVCLVWRLALGSTFVMRTPAQYYQTLPDEETDLVCELTGGEDLLSLGKATFHGTYWQIPVTLKYRPDRRVIVDYILSAYGADGSETFHAYAVFSVTPLGFVFDRVNGGFNGDTAVLTCISLFFCGLAVLLFLYFHRARGQELYSYATVYAAGFSLFAGLIGVHLLTLLIRRLLNPGSFSMLGLYHSLSASAPTFLLFTSPLILAFAVQMTVSNIELLRHERPRFQNLLGILAAVLMAAGAAFGIWLSMRPFMGSEWEYRVTVTIENVYCTAYVYFECMLAGAIICGTRAARRQPEYDRDYIVILGCRFRKDGTLTPLLAGRCDRAIAFREEQLKRTGKDAVLIPSGGQGPDESMPESHAMANYLLSKGVPETSIRREDRSRNTYENMAFSRAIIEAENPEAKTGFSTTNYHVFRSGVWARLAGLPAEGMGSRTKWWFWPNAFMRECLGLMRNRLLLEILLFIAMVLFFGTLSMVLHI